MFVFDFKGFDSEAVYYYYNIYQGNLKIGRVEITIDHPMYWTAASVIIDKECCISPKDKDEKTLHYAAEFEKVLKSNLIEFDELEDVSDMTVCFGLEDDSHIVD